MIDSVITNVSKPHRKTNSHNRKSIDNHKLLKRLKFNPEETRRYPFVGVYFDKQKQRLRTYSYNKKFVRQWCASAVDVINMISPLAACIKRFVNIDGNVDDVYRKRFCNL